MLLVSTKLDKSDIHGIGLFALQSVQKGDCVWKYDSRFVVAISPDELSKLTSHIKKFFETYSWKENGLYCVNLDNERFINHSDEGNCRMSDLHTMVAARDIECGEELSIDYREFDEDFGNPELGYDWKL